jgi:hypothetical protein
MRTRRTNRAKINRERLIRPRKKGDPIKVLGEIPYFNTFAGDDEGIELTIRTSERGWEKLAELALCDPETLGRHVYLQFAKPVQEFIYGEKQSDRRSAFMRESRQYVAAIYVVARHYAQIPRSEWPDSFRHMVEQLEAEKASIINPKKGTPVASRIAYLCWKKKFEELEGALNLREKKTNADFKRVYLDVNPYLAPAQKYFKDNNHIPTPSDILTFLKGLP